MKLNAFRIYLPIAATFAFGIFFSISGSYNIARWKEEEAATRFKTTASMAQDRYEHALQQRLQTLYSVASFFSASDEITAREFDSFTSPLIRRQPDITNIVYLAPAAIGQSSKMTPSLMRAAQSDSLEELAAEPLAVSTGDKTFEYPLYTMTIDGLQKPHQLPAIAARKTIPQQLVINQPQAVLLDYPVALFFIPLPASPTTQGLSGGTLAMQLNLQDIITQVLANTDMPQAGLRPLRPGEQPESLIYRSQFTLAGAHWPIGFTGNSKLFSVNLWESSLVLFGGLIATLLVAAYWYRLLKLQASDQDTKAQLRRENAAKEKLNQELEESIEQARVARHEALAAQQAAERANRAKSDFLANMSHEIRTPMNGVLGVAQLLANMPLTPEQQGLIDLIKKSGDNLVDLINSLMDFSKIEAGKMVLESTPYNPIQMVEEVTDTMRLLAQQNGVSMHTHIDITVPNMVVGDPRSMRQILTNLLGNAVKFTPSGHIDIRVKARSEENNQIRLQFEIEDTGIGIPADKLSYIFLQFSQAEESTARHYGGTGLGLTISERLVTMQHGHMDVESTLGQGSIFSFNVLLGRASAEILPLPVAEDRGEPMMVFEGKRALVVEDNPINMLVTTKLLDMLGIPTDMAENGRLALERFEKGTYDIIFMDCHMPGMDGYETTRRIRESEHQRNLKRTPIIALTADVGNSDRERCIAAGMDDYLAKPVRSEHIGQMLLRWLNDGKPKGPMLADSKEA